MTSLPPEVPTRVRDIAEISSAYGTCLRLKKSFHLAVDKGSDAGNNLIYIRILGHLIHYVPTDQGLKNIVEEISSCTDNSGFLGYGKMYYAGSEKVHPPLTFSVFA